MINYAGLVYQSRVIAELHRLHVVADDLEIQPHADKPQCWCFTSKVTRRAFQLKLECNGDSCELDYITGAGQWKLIGVYDAEAVAQRAYDFITGKTEEI